MLHGQPGTGADWRGVADLLAVDHRVLVPDRPGYGASGGRPVGMAGNADLLAEMLSKRRAGPATVVGHSYGGGIAALLAGRHPGAARGLVLVGSVGRVESVNAFDRVLGAPGIGEAVSAATLFAVGRLLPRLRPLAGLLPQRVEARVRAALPDHGYPSGQPGEGRRIWRSFVAEQRSLLAEIDDVERALGGLRLPTSVVSGTWDVVVPPMVAALIAGTIRGAELVTVARTGHFVARDAPRAVDAAVRRVEARAAGQ
ncbi:MAG: alpha/beta fold hydrolase [Acidimicrobiales bacterium]